MHVQRELVELGARHQAVAAHVLAEIAQRAGRDAQAVLRHGVANHPGDVAGLVMIATHGDRAGRPLDQLAQARARRQIAGLDDHDGVATPVRGIVIEQIRQRSRGQRVAGVADPHRAPAAGQRLGGDLVGQPRRVVLERRDRQLDDAERIVGAAGDVAHQSDGALVREAAVRPIEQHRAQPLPINQGLDMSVARQLHGRSARGRRRAGVAQVERHPGDQVIAQGAHGALARVGLGDHGVEGVGGDIVRAVGVDRAAQHRLLGLEVA